jgi:catechol 2,3-dioxygenase-like lactoylglutathione lyase family enzyme
MASLGMLTILVDDYDRGLAYFTRTLGFALVEDTFLSPEERWVVIAPDVNQGARILLAKTSSPSHVAAMGKQAGGRVGLILVP